MAARLVERGVLSEDRHKVLGLFGVDRWPEADPEPERALRERLRAELTGAAEVSERTALLAPLLRASDLVGKVVAKDERKAASGARRRSPTTPRTSARPCRPPWTRPSRRHGRGDRVDDRRHDQQRLRRRAAISGRA